MSALTSYDPSTGLPIASVPTTAPASVPDVLARARAAQRDWGRHSPKQRAKQLERAAMVVAANREGLTTLLSQEMGKSLRRASGEVSHASGGLAHLAHEAAEALAPERRRGGTVSYRALGVAGIISPWNYPLAMAVNLIAPALVAGNTVVFKPSEQTPLVADRWVQRLNEDLPDGVLTVVHGDGEQGRAIVDAGVDVIGFTGSMAVGKDIMRRAAPHLIRLVMELGGNDPLIVLPSADLDAAARFAVA